MRLFVSDPHRGATTGFRIFVTILFAELELFTVHFSAWWVRSPAALNNFRALASSRAGLKLRLSSIASDDATARVQFQDALKPSAKKGGWLARLGAVFGARVDAPLAEVLHTLTLWRNEFSHPRIGEHAIDWNDPDIAEAMVAVLFAVKLLSFRLAEAAINRPR